MAEPRRRTVALLLGAVAATEAAVQLGRAFFHPKQGLDLAPPYLAAKLLLQGDRRFYDDAAVGAAGAALGIHGPAGPGDAVLNFIYPPWTPVAYAPLALLPWNAARIVWFLLSVAATGLALVVLARAISRDEDGTRALTIAGFAGTAFLFPVFYGLMTGQSNGLLLLLLAGSLLHLRKGRGLLAGLLLAPAALAKPFLALPALVFLVRKEGRALLGFLLGGGALVLLGIVAGGPDGWGLWWRQISAHNSVGRFEWRNHSLASAALALFAPGGEVEPLVPAPGLVMPFTLAAGLFAALLALVALRGGRAAASPAIGFGAALALGLLLAPKSWEHYGVFLIPAFLALFTALRDEEEPPAPAAVLLGISFGVWAFALLAKEEYAALAGRPLSALLAAKTAATLLLLGLSAWAAGRGRGGGRSSGGA